MFQRMYTASLEKFKIQCNSIVFVFRPRTFTKIPNDLVPFILQQIANRGVFLVPDDVAEGSQEFNKRKREALLAYLGVWLRERIVNHLAQQDDFRRKGVTLLADARFERAIRWEKELRQELQSFAPIEEELSFLEEKRTENTVLPNSKPDVEESYSESAKTVEELPKKKRGRPFKKASQEEAVS